ncbi:MAG: nicotinate phosphoribosyltransferase [Pirellulales bacterium]
MPWVDPALCASGLGLFTDLYELTMAQAYDAEGIQETAVFELFFRSLPPGRNFAVAAGIWDALAYLESVHFTDEDADYLRRQRLFSEDFIRRLREFRFQGDAFAVPEGTVVFPNEPLLQVVAPMIQAQLVETFLLNQLHFQTVIASKAARIVLAAQGRTVVDFGARRAHGLDAALKAARASYLVGADGTSLVEAGKLFDIPVFGTMAHSYVQAHDNEQSALAAFARRYPGTTLLVDTYDTLRGVRHVIELAERLGSDFHVGAIRLDSGDLESLAREARRMLDQAGLAKVKIFASSELDERAIARFVKSDVPIDGFGVGTHLVVSQDAPSLDMAYKLVEYAGRGRTKLSTSKALYPGRKQVFRVVEDGRMQRDIIGRWDAKQDGSRLLVQMLKGGKRLPEHREDLRAAREYTIEQLRQLPPPLAALEAAQPVYPVHVSDELQHDFDALRQSMQPT